MATTARPTAAVAAAAARRDDPVAAEQAVRARIGHLPLDFEAMALLSNLHRVAAAVRRHFETHVLRDAHLSWTGFTVLWSLWIWGRMESRHLAAEANVAKATLTGVVDTLDKHGLVERRRDGRDRRQVSVGLTELGERTISELFPVFNRHETAIAHVVGDPDEIATTIRVLRRMLRAVTDPPATPEATT